MNKLLNNSIPSSLLWDDSLQIWRTTGGKIASETFCDFEDIHLEGNAIERYRVKHDGAISSFQYTVVESKTDTLGGKYPFIRRNGDTYYRQFPLSGLITHFNEKDYPDEYLAENIINYASNAPENPKPVEDYFNRRIKERVADNQPLEDDDTLKEKYDDYYYLNSTLNGYTDYLLEREYREDVLKFLYENKIRLFRSPTEGNILVKLMNITCSPNEQIKRRVYSFQSTAYEVDDFTLANCVKYGIWEDNKSLFTDLFLKGTPKTYVGQLRHQDPADLTVKENGPYIYTDFYEEIEEDVRTRELLPVTLEKVIWMKSTYYDVADQFGQKDGEVAWAIAPNSPLVNDLIVTTDPNYDVNDDIEVEIRDYDIDYAPSDPQYQTLWFHYAVSGDETISPKTQVQWPAVTQLLQQLAYLAVVYTWGLAFSYEDNYYNWDDFKNWPDNVQSAFKNQIIIQNNVIPEDYWLNCSQKLYTKNLNNATVLKSKLAWILNNLIELCPGLSANMSTGSDAALFLERVELEIQKETQDATQNKIKTGEKLIKYIHQNIYPILRKGKIDNKESDSVYVAQAILRLSVGYITTPFTGYWQLKNGEIVAINDPRNSYSKPFIDFWIMLAVTMAIWGGWGFGTPSIDHLYKKSISDLTNGKYILVDRDLRSNILSDFQTGDVSLVGHGMYINDELVIVPPQGYYELTDEDTSITQFSHQRLKDKPLTCLIDYVALGRVYELEELIGTRKTTVMYYKVGQIRGVRNNKDVIQKIKNKYNQDVFSDNASSIKRTVIAVPYLSIETEPYALVYIQDSNDVDMSRDPQQHRVNSTGILTFYSKGTNIEKAYIKLYGPSTRIVHRTIAENDGIVYDNQQVLSDTLINYVCLIKETRY